MLFVCAKKEERKENFMEEQSISLDYYWMHYHVRVFLGDGNGVFLAEPDPD